MGSHPSARLIVASPDSSSDLYYKTGFLAPDPVVFLEQDAKTSLLVSPLEFARAQATARVSEVLSLESLRNALKSPGETLKLPELLGRFLLTNQIEALLVPPDFPALFYVGLSAMGLRVDVQQELPFFPERLQKSPQEVGWIKDAIEATEHALKVVVDILKRARVKEGRVVHEGEPLTSERLRNALEHTLFENGLLAQHTIVASGPLSALPHEEGHGPILAHTPIVIDVFPRSLQTRYFADITRTFVKGRPPERLERMYHAVLEAQEIAIERLRAGVSASSVHRAVAAHFEASGFSTDMTAELPFGFIHTTGHGLGLDIHEPPRIGNEDILLPEGAVLTVEPGLYYPDLGGVRIEDDVALTKDGLEVLSSFPKDSWVFP
jgi:Xaa-Pro aminopeptidase